MCIDHREDERAPLDVGGDGRSGNWSSIGVNESNGAKEYPSAGVLGKVKGVVRAIEKRRRGVYLELCGNNNHPPMGVAYSNRQRRSDHLLDDEG